jgi:hypothetical protein
MFDEREFPRFFVDTRAAEAALYTKVQESVDELVARRKKTVRTLRRIDELLFDTHATLPAEANTRISASEGGYITITITDLNSFHDISEVIGVFANEFGDSWFPKPNIFDAPESRAREFSFGFNTRLWIKAVLGPDADCKIVVTGTKPLPRREVELEKIILCPGDPRYDDY